MGDRSADWRYPLYPMIWGKMRPDHCSVTSRGMSCYFPSLAIQSPGPRRPRIWTTKKITGTIRCAEDEDCSDSESLLLLFNQASAHSLYLAPRDRSPHIDNPKEGLTHIALPSHGNRYFSTQGSLTGTRKYYHWNLWLGYDRLQHLGCYAHAT